jgi:hypothetical protein
MDVRRVSGIAATRTAVEVADRRVYAIFILYQRFVIQRL